MKKKIILLGFVLSLSPVLVFAADAFSILATIAQLLDFVMPILVALAVVYFIWGVIQYTVSTDEEAKKGARGKIIQGLIGLFIIVAFWGILSVVKNTFGIGPQQLNPNDIPCIENRDAGIFCN